MSCWMREIERWTVSPAEQAEFDAGEGTNRASHWKETTDLSQRNELSEDRPRSGDWGRTPSRRPSRKTFQPRTSRGRQSPRELQRAPSCFLHPGTGAGRFERPS